MKPAAEHQSSRVLLLVLALAAAFLALAFRATQVVGTDLFHPSLWGEDGTVFINEADEFGLASIVRPYAGYLHLIPRLVAYGASFLPLEHAPLLFHLAWLSIFIVFICIVHLRLEATGVPPAFHVWAVVLLVMQPQAGEVYFTLTNMQWFSGLALVAYLIFPFERRVRTWHIGLIAAAGLTGPFSILAMPMLALRAFLYRDLRANLAVYSVVTICAAIQAAFIISAPKILGAQASANGAEVWLSALVRFLAFGGQYPLASAFAFVFWAAMPWRRISKAVTNRFGFGPANESDIPGLSAFLMIFIAFGMIAIGFLRDNPATMGPVILVNGAAGGSRYYLIPYSLLILAAVVSTIRDYPRAFIVLGAFSVISAANFVRPDRADFQWRAYSRLARVVPDMVIPIAPRIEGYPGWSVNAGRQYDASGLTRAREISISLADVVIENGEVVSTEGRTVLRSSADNFLLTFPRRSCGDSEIIGLKVSGRRSSGGWMHVMWAGMNRFNDKDSVLRYYPHGAFTGYFAFEPESGHDAIRVRPGLVSGDAEISEIRMFCLI